ncbi:MAG TPA: aminoglycoside phosphotransferase family protein [Longimicrobium sp.]
MSVIADRPSASLAALDPPVAAEVIHALSELAGRDVTGWRIDVRELRRAARVCRVQAVAGAAAHSVIVKRLSPPRAHRSRLAAERWLPAVGLRDAAPALLGAIAPPGVAWVWHIYEDAGIATLHDRPADHSRADAAVALMAALHAGGAGHPLLPECRAEGQDFGTHHFLTRVGDARRLLEVLRTAEASLPGERSHVLDGLRAHLDALAADAPRRIRAFEQSGVPETMLHGDLWTTNVVVSGDGQRRAVRIIDWDRAGAGPATYDLSTFLLRFPPAERARLLAGYRASVGRFGWRVPQVGELNLLCDTAECGRYADRVVECAIALLQDDAEWAHDVLAEVLRWFEALAPVIPES